MSSRAVLAVVTSVCLAAPALAEDANVGPRLGEAPAVLSVAPPPPTPNATYGSRVGTLTFKFNISVKSAIASTDKIYCVAYAGAYGLQSNSEQATKVATRSGNTATCTVVVPYSWANVDTTSGYVSLNVSIYAGSTQLTGRYVSRSLPTLPMPANGANTPITVAMTL